MTLAVHAIDWSYPHLLTEVLRLVCIVLGIGVLAMAIPVGRRYFHPIFVPVFFFLVLWDVSSTFTEIGRLGTKMTWRVWVNTGAESIALAWQILLMWRWRHFGKINYGAVRDYYRGLRQGYEPSAEEPPGT